jgi:hypothetical protein
MALPTLALMEILLVDLTLIGRPTKSKLTGQGERLLLAGFILFASVSTSFAQNDRTLSIEMNRDSAETRIERLHNERTRGRLQEQKNKKSPAKRKRPQQYLQF